jgi:hypothetical protein
MRALLLLFFMLPALSHAHGGGLDSQGGHTARASGEYHCHREPCFSNQQSQHDAEREARQQGRPFTTLYDREQWPHWLDSDGDCQDTRAEILIRQSQTAVVFAGNDPCRVDYGRWLDPYTNTLFHDAAALDIDHIVPLRHAHGHGGHAWSVAVRRRFANDPDNLLAVSASANRSKGHRGPDEWRPPHPAFWCEYARRWQAIKQRYALQVTPPEQTAIAEMLATCP